MVKRNIPFGYAMVKGEIVICEPEAEAVRQIFSMYLHEDSLREIAGAITVPYNEGTTWDKHKVKRILDNPRYTGAGGYPKLIDKADHVAAKRLKAGKNSRTPLPCPEDIQALKAAAFCHNCGGRFLRHPNYHGKVCWRCANSSCGNGNSMSDNEMKNAIASVLQHIIDNPGLLHTGPQLRPTPLAVTRLQNEINREMSKTQPDTNSTQKMLLSLAAEKYASCCDIQAALAFRALFENHEPASQFDRGLFVATVDKVFISDTGAVYLRLKNGQMIPDKPAVKGAPTSC